MDYTDLQNEITKPKQVVVRSVLEDKSLGKCYLKLPELPKPDDLGGYPVQSAVTTATVSSGTSSEILGTVYGGYYLIPTEGVNPFIDGNVIHFADAKYNQVKYAPGHRINDSMFIAEEEADV
jgi:hypothetical protein